MLDRDDTLHQLQSYCTLIGCLAYSTGRYRMKTLHELALLRCDNL